MFGPRIDQMDMCDSCTEDKKIFFIGKVKQYGRPDRTAFLCKDCFKSRCFCSICFKETTYSSYEKHLLNKHTKEQLADQLLNEKVYWDLF